MKTHSFRTKKHTDRLVLADFASTDTDPGASRNHGTSAHHSGRHRLPFLLPPPAPVKATCPDPLHAERDHLLAIARREAEALAWNTPYPHLVLPCLLEEKQREASSYWNQQQRIRNQSGRLLSAVLPSRSLLAA